jgi:hypothetical protein
MADILISQLTAGTPALTDLLIFANPTTGLAKKTTITTFKSNLDLFFADLNDYSVGNLLDEQILYYDSGEWKNTSLKTINGNQLFGSGDIVISGGSGLTSLNALTASTQTFATSSTGTDFTITSATSTHTFNLPSASATNRGLLTAANWTTFNSKQEALVSGTNIKTLNNQSLLTSGDLRFVTFVSASYLETGSDIDFEIETQSDLPSEPRYGYVLTLKMPSASASARGALTSTDWTTFNNKQTALVSGTNIKTVNGASLLGSGNIVISGGTGLTSLNSLTAGTQLFAVASTGTDFTITSTTDTHTFAIPTASASARGLLSSANWTTFNSKQDALVSGTNIKTINGTSILGSGNIAAGSGTVTSVGLSVSIAAFTLTATSDPITTSGTFTISANGDSSQYINGAGNLATFPEFSSTATVIKTVRNQTGSTIPIGTVVYINGASGNFPTIARADASGDSTSAQTIGLTQAAINNNSNGVIVLIGDVTGLDTSAYTGGTQLYLGANGAWTSTKPYAPTHLVYVGIVVKSHPSTGVISVKIQNGYELDELHDVSAQSPANNDGIFFNTTTSLWEKKSIATVLGFTPQAQINGTGFVKASGTTISYDNSTYLTANQSITLSGDVTGSGATSISTTLATVTQASSGNFVKVTLDTKGRVTGNTAVVAADITALGFAVSAITTNRQTASYTLVLGDANKLVELNVATANTLTVPLNSSVAFPIGTQILIAQYGAGACTITAAGGVTLRSEGSKLKTNGQYSGSTLVKIGENEWYAFGNLIS